MRAKVVSIIAILLLGSSLASAVHFQGLIVERYALFEELALILKTGHEPPKVVAEESQRQGKLEAYFQLAGYTLSVVIAVLGAGVLVKNFRIPPGSRRAR